MKKIINYIPAGILSVVVTAIVALVLLLPETEISGSWLEWLHFKNSDKVEHLILFFILNCSYLYDHTKFKNPHHTSINKDLAFTMLAGAIGLLTETAQLAMGLGRSFDEMDIVADLVGAFMGLLFMRLWGGHLLRKYVFNIRSRHRRHHHEHTHQHHYEVD